jgi:hypothetical protein
MGETKLPAKSATKHDTNLRSLLTVSLQLLPQLCNLHLPIDSVGYLCLPCSSNLR